MPRILSYYEQRQEIALGTTIKNRKGHKEKGLKHKTVPGTNAREHKKNRSTKSLKAEVH